MQNFTIKKFWNQEATPLSPGSVGTSFTKLNLSQMQADQVLSSFVEKSLFSLITKNNKPLSANEAIIKYSKLQGAEFKAKATIGNTDYDNWTTSEVVEVTWDAPVVANQAIFAQLLEESSGVEIAAEKAQLFVKQFMVNSERTAWDRLEAKIKADAKFVNYNFSAANETAEKIRNKIIGEARKLTKVWDPTQGVFGVNDEDIAVFVKPEVLDKLAAVVVGNNAVSALNDGANAVTKVGGFDVFANPYLNAYDIVVTTKFVGVKADKLTNVYAGYATLNSKDIVVTVEGKSACAVLYSKLAVGLAATDRPNANANTYEQKPKSQTTDLKFKPN